VSERVSEERKKGGEKGEKGRMRMRRERGKKKFCMQIMGGGMTN
jgi:hypothetical protein